MPAPLHLQQWNSTGPGPLAVAITGVTAGSTLALVVFQTLSATRTYTASDNVDGAWTAGPLATLSATRVAQIFYKLNSSGGSKTVTVTPNAGTTEIHVSVVELGPSTASVSSSFVEATTTQTGHHCAAAGELDTPANCYILSGAVLNGSGGSYTKNANCTLVRAGDATNGFLAQYRRSDPALTDERFTWTSTTARNTAGVSMAFQAAGGGGGGAHGAAAHYYRNLLGA